MLCRSPASGPADDRGSITAEFAVALPAVALLLVFALGAIAVGGEQLRLQEAAFDAARLLGRGEPGALDRVREVAPDASVVERQAGDAVCAETTAPVHLGVLSGIVLRATGCALSDAEQ